jgi:hypothetical protein
VEGFGLFILQVWFGMQTYQVVSLLFIGDRGGDKELLLQVSDIAVIANQPLVDLA